MDAIGFAPTAIHRRGPKGRAKDRSSALAAKADVIMLDNMSLDQMREAVAIVDGRIPLEASGGVTFDAVRAVAETGVDYISSSKMIQAAPAVDIGLDEA